MQYGLQGMCSEKSSSPAYFHQLTHTHTRAYAMTPIQDLCVGRFERLRHVFRSVFLEDLSSDLFDQLLLAIDNQDAGLFTIFWNNELLPRLKETPFGAVVFSEDFKGMRVRGLRGSRSFDGVLPLGDFIMMCEVQSNCEEVEFLDLADNNLFDEDIIALARVFDLFVNLTAVNLANNQIFGLHKKNQDLVDQVIISLLDRPKIMFVDIRGNPLGSRQRGDFLKRLDKKFAKLIWLGPKPPTLNHPWVAMVATTVDEAKQLTPIVLGVHMKYYEHHWEKGVLKLNSESESKNQKQQNQTSDSNMFIALGILTGVMVLAQWLNKS